MTRRVCDNCNWLQRPLEGTNHWIHRCVVPLPPVLKSLSRGSSQNEVKDRMSRTCGMHQHDGSLDGEPTPLSRVVDLGE